MQNKVDVAIDKSVATSPLYYGFSSLVGCVTCVKGNMVYVESKIAFSISHVIQGSAEAHEGTGPVKQWPQDLQDSRRLQDIPEEFRPLISTPPQTPWSLLISDPITGVSRSLKTHPYTADDQCSFSVTYLTEFLLPVLILSHEETGKFYLLLIHCFGSI
ncbi:hypothetical protein STEG23_025244 [Scotinomys teguina]